MRKVKAAAIQMSCLKDYNYNLKNAEKKVREAVQNGAEIILLPELFARQYFCQERRYDYYEYAEEADKALAVTHFMRVAKELDVVILVSFYERDINCLYNSEAIIDADGKLLGIYRKTHIPDDHYYQEKFYFKPGNTGFKVWHTKYADIGVGICWDQWFSETARCLAVNGAELIFYPTAIGSEPILGCDSSKHWQRCMQGHAAANIVPVIAANRYGTETVTPSEENGGQSSSLCFYGKSFITDESGDIIAEAPRDKDAVLIAEFDLDEIKKARDDWGIFRDRRPEMYSDMLK